ncbi:VOC family protein [Falsihalocynthiibacter sp. S25ZX9]|uniref:VOC family protein n=1 Tax=Falsihalocynthiibacter sp. S25ZX9 TaxID=3240870 RepID=UPI00350EF3ED
MSNSPKHSVVWAEIPVTNLEAGRKFYSAVLDTPLKIEEFGGGEIIFFPMQDQAAIAGHIYAGTPAPTGTGPTVHLAIYGNLEAAITRAKDAGATLVREPVTIPSGRFQYIADPDGNSIGLFEVAT